MLNYIWSTLILVGIIVAAATGNIEHVSEAILDSTRDAMDLLVLMAGVVSMWNGFLTIAEGSGLTKYLSGKMKPLLHLLFPRIPKEHIANDYICANFIANILGLGWACTPTGLAAMKALARLEQERGNERHIASDEMCTFLILNISSLQLIPMNLIAYRTRYGSTAPMAVIAPGLITTTLTTLLAIVLCKLITSRSKSRKEPR